MVAGGGGVALVVGGGRGNEGMRARGNGGKSSKVHNNVGEGVL